MAPNSSSDISRNNFDRIWIGLTAAMGVICTVMLIIYLVAAIQWRNQPFIGVLFTPIMAVDTSRPLGTEPWPGIANGLQPLDHIIAITHAGENTPLFEPEADGQIVLTGASNYEGAWGKLRERWADVSFGSEITVEYLRGAGSETCEPVGQFGGCQITYEVQRFPDNDFIGYFILPFVTSIAILGIGFGVFWLRPHQPAARLLTIITFTAAVLLAGLFDIDATHRLIPLWLIINALLGGTLFTLSIVFPVRLSILNKHPHWQYAPYAFTLVTIPIYLWLNANPPSPDFQVNICPFLTVVVGLLAFIVSLFHNRRFAPSGIVRDQSNTILIGLALTSVPIVIWLLNIINQMVVGDSLVPFNVSAATPFILITPLSMAYAVLQYRFFETDRVISQGITYILMLVALVSGYALLVFSVSLIFTQEISGLSNNPLLIGGTIFLIALLFLPFRSTLQARIDRIYFRRRYDFQDYVEIFTHEISQLRDIQAVAAEFAGVLNQTLTPSNLFVFVPDRQTGQYVALSSPERKTDIAFPMDNGVVQALQANDYLIYLEPGREWPAALRGERARLQILDALVILGLRGSEQLNGFIVIGPPQSGQQRYQHEELFFIQSLVSQMSIAAERAQVVESLQRRVQELDVLSQVGQAVNFAIDLDYLMELLNAQTNKLIAAAYFYIALRDEVTNELYFAFFLEGDERYEDRENQPWKLGNDLFSEVVRLNQPLRVANYSQAMTQRNATTVLADSNLKAWMGVPLVAGTHTLGAMAVGTKQPGQTYGNDHFRIFSDISSLAATSIERARLFAETNKRAAQLKALNDVSSQLASQQQDVQRLLELITNSAVRILDAEAGSLLLTTQDDSDELEFSIAVGAVGQDLVGKRFPANQGLAGDVIKTGQFVIVNDAANDPRWVGEKAVEGFQTSSVLAVPLTANNQTLGVLEVLNKKGRSIFIEEDANLLTTFAGQAAVAIDNARLFQMTDKQLGDRVEELEALERIDVELNRSLDISKVANLTLRWAISQSGATAGALGLVVGEDSPMLEIVARYGYRDDDLPEGYTDNLWPLDRGIVSRVMRTRQFDLAADVQIDPDYIPGQRHALSQITMPMLSGDEINALLILEKNTEPRLSLVDLAFVQRLTEHASIALVNAQLYVDLARANDSKSEFVSFVAHELKTPMTSIKGYTDLLLGGVTGEVNEQQETFLGTIKGNIERMNTLVSDLNDVTKLQTNNFHMEFTPVDFREVVDETLRPLQRQIDEKEQDIDIRFPEDLPPILADQNRLIQVLTNMVSNAYKYTPAQGNIQIIGEVVDNQWDPKSNNTDPVLHVYVKDNGIGMSEADLAKLFTPYFRSDNPDAREQPGTGLGLTITRGIVERHGGQIWVESELGTGTAFHFTVPLAAERQPSE